MKYLIYNDIALLFQSKSLENDMVACFAAKIMSVRNFLSCPLDYRSNDDIVSENSLSVWFKTAHAWLHWFVNRFFLLFRQFEDSQMKVPYRTSRNLLAIRFHELPIRSIRLWSQKVGALLLFCLVWALSCLAPQRAEAAFGLTNSGGYYTVDTSAGLVFKVKQANGDITSLNYNGTEYQDQARFSQINSGLGTATVTGTLWGSQSIVITVEAGTLTHYYLARKNQNNIYMGTYFTEEPSIGLVRYIVRIPSAKLPNGPTTSDIRNNTGAIEASDVFGYANGQTRSKHYSDHRLMDFAYTGATGTNVGVFMVRSNHEGGSGGPFYRTIDNQCGDDQEIYEIVNYGEGQTEPFRLGVFNGPYILTFTNGAAPTTPIDISWIHSTGIDATLKGWVQDRGTVTGQASGIPDGIQGVVGFANSTAQYWCVVGNGSFSSPAMIPGTYTMTLYKGELSVASTSVTVTAGATPTVQNIASTETVPNMRWRIGDWDGTPNGFLNADKVTAMHPSDVRMSAWGPVTYTVGSSTASSFPAYQWKDVNNPTTVQFNLSQSQLTSHTLRAGITCAYANARPQVTLNSWSSSIPSPSTQPDTRTLTTGTYRGNNVTYTYNIPASAFVVGMNTLKLYVVSGSGSTKFLSAGYSYDCVELDAPWTGTFRITPQHTQDKALTVLNSNPSNSTPTVISTYQPSTGQQFLLDLQTDGSYRIRTGLTGNRCVELPFGNASNGTPIKLWDDNGNSAQRWNIVPVVGDWVKIVPKNDAAQCMAVSGGPTATANGTPVQSWAYTGLSSQLWKLTPIDTPSTNAAPAAQSESYNTSEDNTLSVPIANGVLINDTDSSSLTVADAEPFIEGVQPLVAPKHGTLTLNADGSFAYTPAANFNGSDSFSYQATDGTLLSDVVAVTITVTPVNDAPVATEQDVTTPQDTALTIALAASDVEGDSLTYSIVGAPTYGTLSGTAPNLTYTPSAGYKGNDQFTFKVNDGSADSATVIVRIAVTGINHAPNVTVSLSPSAPTTNALLTATATGGDPENDMVSFSYVWKRNDVVLDKETTKTLDLSKVRNGDRGDIISVTVTPSDEQLSGESVTLKTTIINSAPTLPAVTFNGSENSTLIAKIVGGDEDKDLLSYKVVQTALFGKLTLQSDGNFSFVPNRNWNGTDSFVASATDANGDSVNATFTLKLVPVNGSPIAASDTVNATEDVPLTILASTLLKNDSNGESADEVDALTITQISVSTGFPGALKLDVAKQTILFTPKSNWNGTTSFNYTIQDSSKVTSFAKVTLVVAPVNDAPMAASGQLTVRSGMLGELQLQGSDVDGDSLTFALSAKPKNGTAQVVKMGTQWMLRYTSKVGFGGTDSLSVVARDSKLSSAPATIKVTVLPNHVPVVSRVTLVPTAPKTDDPLIATIVASDADKDVLSYVFTWKRLRAGQMATIRTIAKTQNTDTLDTKGSVVVVGDTITVSVVAKDAQSASVAKSASVTIQNTPVTFAVLNLAPTAPKTNDVLQASVQTQDADGTIPDLTYVWSKTSVGKTTTVLQTTTKSTTSTLDLSKVGNGNKGNTITLTVTAKDGSSTATQKASVVVANSLPVLSSLKLAPVAPSRLGKVIATYTGNDADATDRVDTLTYTYQWRVGTRLLSAEKTSALELSKYAFVKTGDIVSLEMRVGDGSALSAVLKSSVIVSGTTPKGLSASSGNS